VFKKNKNILILNENELLKNEAQFFELEIDTSPSEPVVEVLDDVDVETSMSKGFTRCDKTVDLFDD